MIIAPGWFMTKDSQAFLSLSYELEKKFDVIALDFRGHGESGGFYTFSAKESLELEETIKFAKEKYKKVYLIGFSLGGTISAICCANSISADKLILVSSPCDFSRIENHFYSPRAFVPTFKKFELKRWLSIRPSIIIHNKIKPIDCISKITSPTLFIGGRLDPTVGLWHTQELYNRANCKKKLKIFEKGFHAEDLFLDFRKEFLDEIFGWLS